MIIKVGDKLHSSLKEPVMIIISKQEQELIAQMGDQKYFCVYPEGSKQEDIEKFMEVTE